MSAKPLLRTVLMILSLGLCWAQAWSRPADSAPLRVVGFPYPPFMLIDESSKPAGPMVELVAEAFRRMGQPVRIELLPLARALLQVETGEAGAMFTVKKTPEREAKYLFSSEPVLFQHYVIFVASESTLAFRGDLNALAMASIGVVGGTSYGAIFDAAARQGVFKKLEVTSQSRSQFQEAAGATAWTRSCAAAPSAWKSSGNCRRRRRVKISGPAIETTQSHVMFNKAVATPQLVARFDQAVRLCGGKGCRVHIPS